MEAISIGVGTLRALGEAGYCRWHASETEVRRTYTVVKLVDTDPAISIGARGQVQEDAANVLREAAGQTLIGIYGGDCFDIVAAGLRHQEDGVKITSAITLGRLGDRRAVPLLLSLEDHGSPMLMRAAQEAVAAIRRGNPEMMTLLRGSSAADARPDTLLRPVVLAG